MAQGVWNLLDPRGRGIIMLFVAAMLRLTNLEDMLKQLPEEMHLAGLVLGMGLLGPTTFISFPALLVHTLTVIGFSSAGPVAGSPAARLQSLVYGGGVEAGTAFSFAQKVAMGKAAQAMTMGSQLLKKERAKL